MKRGNVVILVLCIPVVAIDVALFVTGRVALVTLVSTLAAFTVVVSLYWFLTLRGQRVEKDERTIRLNRKALAYSWLLSIYAVILLIGSDSLGLLRLSGLQYLGIVVMVMTFSYLILYVVMIGRGSVE